MNRLIGMLRFLTAIPLMAVAVVAVADISGASVTPNQRQLTWGTANSVPLTWQVTTTRFHRAGATSSAASLINPDSGAVIGTVGIPLTAPGGGPFTFNETVSISAARIGGWQRQGISSVLLQRVFDDPGSSATAVAAVTLLVPDPGRSSLTAARDATGGELSVRGLRLEFETGNNTALVNANAKLKARLTVLHSGTGLLEGRWLLAEPGSTEGEPVFRTLALTRSNLTAGQQNQLSSPDLPTQRVGKYLLRFCVTDSTAGVQTMNTQSPQCPLENLIVEALYQVQGSGVEAIGNIRGLSPDQQRAGADTAFRWQAVPEATIYQLHVFVLDAAWDLPALGGDSKTAKPEFVVGMVLPKGTEETSLSELVRSKLQSGRRYLWRITAHDDLGRLVATSSEYSFTYQAGESH